MSGGDSRISAASPSLPPAMRVAIADKARLAIGAAQSNTIPIEAAQEVSDAWRSARWPARCLSAHPSRARLSLLLQTACT